MLQWIELYHAGSYNSFEICPPKTYQSSYFTNATISVKMLSDGDRYVFELSKKNYTCLRNNFLHCTQTLIFQLLVFYESFACSRPIAALQPPCSRPTASSFIYCFRRLQGGYRAAIGRLCSTLLKFLQKFIFMFKHKFIQNSGLQKRCIH